MLVLKQCGTEFNGFERGVSFSSDKRNVGGREGSGAGSKILTPLGEALDCCCCCWKNSALKSGVGTLDRVLSNEAASNQKFSIE